MPTRRRTTTILMAILAAMCCSHAMAAKKPLKVFILAGQSNMVGMGRGELSERGAAELKKKGLSDEAIAKKGKGTLKRLTTDANKAETYQHIIDKDGQWIVRDDV